jgi:hypothetical protein
MKANNAYITLFFIFAIYNLIITSNMLGLIITLIILAILLNLKITRKLDDIRQLIIDWQNREIQKQHE